MSYYKSMEKLITLNKNFENSNIFKINNNRQWKNIYHHPTPFTCIQDQIQTKYDNSFIISITKNIIAQCPLNRIE